MTMIKTCNLKKKYGKGDGEVDALRGVDVEIKEGEIVAIMGKSGSGKSTLLNILGGMMKFDEGEYLYQGKELKLSSSKKIIQFRRNKVGFIVQYFALIPDITVYKNVELPLRYQGCRRKERKKKVNEVLNKVGLSDKVKAFPDELSGGQQQRVAIARALVKTPELILADEPTGALDRQTSNEIMQVFHQLNQDGHTIVIVTHDKDVAAQCDRIIELADGQVIE